MSGSEEDPYSRIFSSLKHPTRRLLLRSLKEQPSKRFSKLQSELGIDSPTLSYHLDSLTGLVDKKGDGYLLTDLGVAASNLMGRVEETKRAPPLP
jgi:fatty-acyl-CoA synthase